jgi:SNF2 family DNA or RNA helicase
MTTVRDALNCLLSVCDGAHSLDGCGFNGRDAPIARSLGDFKFWSKKQQDFAHRILGVYIKQLERHGIDYHALVNEKTREEYAAEPKKPEQKPTIEYSDGRFIVHFPYAMLSVIKSLKVRNWNKEKKQWEIDPEKLESIDSLIQLISDYKDKIAIDVTPSAQKVIDKHVEEVEAFKKSVDNVAKIKVNSLPDIPVPLKTKPFDHQKRAFLIGSELDTSAFLMEMGTGKTFAAVAVVGKRYLDGQVRKLLVLAPLSVIHVWKNEFKQHADFPHDVMVLDGSLDDKKLDLGRTANHKNLSVVVVSYDSSWRLAEELKAWKPDMMILDESQRIKNREAKRSEFIHDLGDIVKYKMILTGTPVTQAPLDIWSQYRFLNKKIFGDNFWKFRSKYAIMGGFEGKMVIGYQNLDELSDHAHSIAYRVLKKDALDLPDFTDQIMYCELKPETMKIYKEVEKQTLLEIEESSCSTGIIITKLLRLSQLTGGFLPFVDDEIKSVTVVKKLGDEKLTLLRDIVEDLPLDKKFVVFCRFLPEVHEIEHMFSKMNITCKAIYGEISGSKRNEIIQNFQNEKDPRALVIQIATGGLGITLTAADTAIFYSNSYSYADFEQARARLHRIGQKNHVTYIHLIAKHTIDQKVMEALQQKRNLADIVVDRKGEGKLVWV